MSPRLPTPGGDDNSWGSILNDFLRVAHNNDGSLKDSILVAKADRDSVVHKTGDETIEGAKIFDQSPIVPIPSEVSQAANKGYVDSVAIAGAPDATLTSKGLVQLSGDLSGSADAPVVVGLADAANNSSKLSRFFTPEQYGAVGDGVANDTAALQAAVAAANGHILQLRPGATYRITATIVVNVAKVRGIEGYNAHLRIDADVSALRIEGGLTSTAAPNSANTQAIRPEMNPYIRNVRIHSLQTPYVGTGLEIRRTFGLRVNGCHFYGLKNGINIAGRNRNIIITDNHIYDCLEKGLWLSPTSNLHQGIANNNHVSYCHTCVSIDGVDELHDFHLVGNDIELGQVPQATQDCVRITGNDIEGINIVGNTIEAHGGNAGALIHMTGGSIDSHRMLSICSNRINNPGAEVIQITGGRNIIIDNNISKGRNNAGHFVKLVTLERIQSVSISNNNLYNSIAGLLHIDGAGTTHYVAGLSVQANVGDLIMGIPVNIHDVSIYNVSISNNIFDMHPSAQHQGEGSAAISVFANIGYLRSVHIRSNMARIRHKLTHCVRVDAAELRRVIVSENNSWDASTSSHFVLPTNVHMHAYNNVS